MMEVGGLLDFSSPLLHKKDKQMKNSFRLDKFLADMGVGTRSQVKSYIKNGRVKVNDMIINRPETKVNTSSDIVTMDGQAVSYVSYEYYMLNKPAGVVSATEDKKHETVIDLIVSKNRKDLFPVGRLDIDTEGLLLITNDGQLAHNLLSPKKHIGKRYFSQINGRVTEATKKVFEEGIDIGEADGKLFTGQLEILESGEVSTIELVIYEGRFHQVKRMFEAMDLEVVYLKRLAMGSLALDEALPCGEYRPLTEAELKEIQTC